MCVNISARIPVQIVIHSPFRAHSHNYITAGSLLRSCSTELQRSILNQMM